MKKKKIIMYSLLSLLLFAATGCASTPQNNTTASLETTALNSDAGDNSAEDNASVQKIVLSNPLSVNILGVSVSDTSLTISSPGTYSISGNLDNGGIVVDTEGDVVLELNNATIKNAAGPAITVNNANTVSISSQKDSTNSLSDGGNASLNAALFSNDSLILNGEGSLSIDGSVGHAIECDDDVLIESGTLFLSAITDGIHANEEVVINGGTITLSHANEGIESQKDLIINGGNLEILSKDDSLNATNSISINGGTLYCESSLGDAIDSNGSIAVTGGTTIALGASAPEGGIDCDQNNFNITGGTLIAGGGSNSTPASSSTQPVVQLGNLMADSLLHIGNSLIDVLNYKLSKNSASLLLSTPNLSLEQSYDIETDGSYTGGSSFKGLSSGGIYTSSGNILQNFTTTEIITILGGDAPRGGERGGKQILLDDMPTLPEDGNMPQGMPPSEI